MTTKPDRWAAPNVQYAMITYEHRGGTYTAKCKHPVEGKRCNAKFIGDLSVVRLMQHLREMHDYRFDWPQRFSGKIV